MIMIIITGAFVLVPTTRSMLLNKNVAASLENRNSKKAE